MGSRDKDQTTPHQPLLSSLVIRPVESGGGSGGGPAAGVGGGNDYEPGEVRRDQPPPYPRSSRFHGDNGLSFCILFNSLLWLSVSELGFIWLDPICRFLN